MHGCGSRELSKNTAIYLTASTKMVSQSILLQRERGNWRFIVVFEGIFDAGTYPTQLTHRIYY